MKLHSHIKSALNNLTSSKMRTFLAMMGIMVGTASVVALLSAGQLGTQQALEAFKSLGTDLMRLDFFMSDPDPQKKALPLSVTKNIIEEMKYSIPDITAVAPYINTSFSVVFGTEVKNEVAAYAITDDLPELINLKIDSGRLVREFDTDKLFCVLGSKFAKSLKSPTLVGSRIKLKDSICTIIGIAKPWTANSIFYEDFNDGIIISLSQIPKISPESSISSALLRLKEKADIDTVKQQVNRYFNQNMPNYSVNFQSSKELISSMTSQRNIFTLLLGFIGSISLIVGGIGIMNIMLASVAERHQEIGLRVALGAKPADIQIMFLVEAAILAFLGGGAGVIVGIAATLIIVQVAGWNYIFLFFPPFLGFTISVIVSLFFGFYPAYKASRLNPIDVLRGN